MILDTRVQSGTMWSWQPGMSLRASEATTAPVSDRERVHRTLKRIAKARASTRTKRRHFERRSAFGSGSSLATPVSSTTWSASSVTPHARPWIDCALRIVGVAPDTAVLLSTSRASAGRIGAGSGFCVVGPRETLDMQPTQCAERARGFGVSGLHALGRHLDVRVGLDSRSSTPFTLAAVGGFIAHVEHGPWWLHAAPSLSVGIVGRDAGNRERVLVPVYAGASFDRVALHLRTGAEGALDTMVDTLAIPLGIGATVAIGRLRVGAEASLDHAFGPQNTLARRSAAMFVELPFERIYR